MWYIYPDNKEKFFLSEDLLENLSDIKNYKPKYQKEWIQDYVDIINKYGRIYRNIPFVKSIYISNSLSFGNIHKGSDIDLFVVAKSNRMWLVKFFTSMMFFIFGLKRGANKYKKICLWFFVEEDYLDFYAIAIKPIDLYLSYWLVHLQPLYMEGIETQNDIYIENKWTKNIIPNSTLEAQKILWNKIFVWKWLNKKVFEKILNFNFLNKIISWIWKPIMKYKRKKLGKNGKNIIITNKMLKFFWPDIRKDIYLKYKVLKSNDQKKSRRNNNENGNLFS